MDNKRFGKNKERSFNKRGGRKSFGSSDFSSDEDNRKQRDVRGSEKRFGSNRKSFSKDNRSDRKSFSKDNNFGRDSYSEKSDEKRKSFTRGKRSERSNNRNSFGRYDKSKNREEREEKSFERKDRNYNNRKDSKWSDRKSKFSVKRKDQDEFSENKFKADRETLQKRHYSKKKQLEHKLKNLDKEEGLRLNRYIANAGVCSRREADRLIEEGRITVNGKVVTEVGTKVKLTDTVKADGKFLNPEKKVYILLNKPKDFVTTVTDPMGRKTVMDLIKDACKERVFPVGRLDRMTSGLLLFTNDGDLAKKLTHPKYDKKKIYHAFLDKDLTKSDMLKIAEGFELEDGFIQADEISYVDNIKNQVGIEIHSGKNRIVRRIFEHFGYTVEKLDRVYFAGLTKKNLPRGRWRMLTEKEISMLKSY